MVPQGGRSGRAHGPAQPREVLSRGRGSVEGPCPGKAWIVKAANQDRAPAYVALGALLPEGTQYFEGDGLPKDYKQAATWFL